MSCGAQLVSPNIVGRQPAGPVLFIQDGWPSVVSQSSSKTIGTRWKALHAAAFMISPAVWCDTPCFQRSCLSGRRGLVLALHGSGGDDQGLSTRVEGTINAVQSRARRQLYTVTSALALGATALGAPLTVGRERPRSAQRAHAA